MNEHYITVALVYLMIGLVSFFMYDGKSNAPDQTSERPRVESVSSFIYMYRFSQILYGYALIALFFGHHELTKSVFHSTATLYAGAWLSVVGIMLFAGAKLTLGRNYSNCSKMYLPNDVVMQGIYKYIRHPIYTANLFIILGLFVATGDLLVAATWLCMLVYYSISSRLEEATLEKHFPSYREHVKKAGRFLPRVSFGRRSIQRT